jgi:putative redox protein
MKDIQVTFPGGRRIDAHFDGYTVHTDQPVESGGEGSAPGPFDLFFASIATCVGVYVQDFCLSREISTDGLGVHLQAEKDPERKLFTPIHIEVTLPPDFPAKYRSAVLRTANLCAVKKHIMGQPEFDVVLSE